MAQGLGAEGGALPESKRPAIPGYDLLDRLGEGGMGEVFLARQLSLDREVAVKLVRRELLTEEWFLERLEREARLLARLRNQHLVTVHDFVRLADGSAAVVMELIEGGSLRDRLRQAPAGLPLAEALAVFQQVAAAVATAHAAGVVHRDLKPENILFDADGTVRVTDFGMALSVAQAGPRLSRTGAALGTPGYLAPEQFAGGEPDQRLDLFALGVLLYELLTGRLPLGSFEAPRALRPEIPAAVEAAILQALKPNPADRPQTVTEFLRRLREPDTEKPVLPTQSARPWPRRRLLLGALAAGTAGVLIWARRRKSRPEPGPAPASADWRPIVWPDDLAAATVSGSWRREGEALLSGEGICLLGWAGSLPTACDVQVAITRLGGGHSAGLFFRHPAGFGSAELDGWSRHRSGIQALDGATNERAEGFDFTLESGQEVTLTLELRPDLARMALDGVVRQTVNLAGRRLSVVVPWGWDPGAAGPALALGSYQSPMRFQSLSWRDRTGG